MGDVLNAGVGTALLLGLGLTLVTLAWRVGR